VYKNEFDKLLARGELPKSILLYGEEPYYIQKYSKMLCERITPKENRLLYYFDEYDFDGAKSYLSQASLFGDTNLLVLKHEKPLPTKELKELVALCNKMQNSYFIFELYSNDGKRIASAFSKKENAVDVRFFSPKEYEALNELTAIAKNLGIQIDTSSLQHLLHLLQNDLSLAVKELEKLSCYDEPLGSKELDALVFPLTPLSLYRLYEAILNKEPLEELFAKVEEEDQNEMKILLGLESFLQQLFLFHSYIRLHGKADSKEILGYKLPAFVEEQRTRLAIKIKNYPEIFLTLQECEYLLKTKSNIDKKALLFSYLIKVQALV